MMIAQPKAGWLSTYVGMPFLDGGRARSDGGLDCWGLVRLVYAEQSGIELPSYGEIAASDLSGVAGAIAADCRVDPWREIERSAARALDVVVIAERVMIDGRRRRHPAHVGVMVDEHQMLHVRLAAAAAIVPLTHADIRFRLHGIFRHRDLA